MQYALPTIEPIQNVVLKLISKDNAGERLDIEPIQNVVLKLRGCCVFFHAHVIEPIQNVVLKFTISFTKRQHCRLLNLYRMLYWNRSPLSTLRTELRLNLYRMLYWNNAKKSYKDYVTMIEPIQNVVLKSLPSLISQQLCQALNLYRMLYWNY